MVVRTSLPRLITYGLQYLAVLDMGAVNTRLIGEVQPTNDADALNNVFVDSGHFGIASGGHRCSVKGLVPLRDRRHIGAARLNRCLPDSGQFVHRPSRLRLLGARPCGLGNDRPTLGVCAYHRVKGFTG